MLCTEGTSEDLWAGPYYFYLETHNLVKETGSKHIEQQHHQEAKHYGDPAGWYGESVLQNTNIRDSSGQTSWRN